MQIVIKPGRPLSGSLRLSGDKSLSHRAALFAALADGESVIDNFLVAGVTRAMLDALSACGVTWVLEGSLLSIQGSGLHGLEPPGIPLNCGNSATTMRLLAGMLAAAGIPAILDGSDGLRRRPMGRIVEPLRQMGVPIQASQGGTAPLRLAARSAGQLLTGLDYSLPVASAQVKTCLLLAALGADRASTLREPELSRDHSERMLAAMGVDVRVEGTQVVLVPPQPARLKAIQMALPGDISAAAFLVVAALITPGSELELEDVLLNPTRTGLLDALRAMGAEITLVDVHEEHGEPVGQILVRSSTLHGTEIDGSMAVRMIDEFPAFAVAAAYASGLTLVRGASELRHKESDRITALCSELRRLGIAVEEFPDGFAIHGGNPLSGGVVSSCGDHRLAMALSVAGLAAEQEVLVEGAEIIAESFPNFVDVMRSLGADASLVA